MPAEHGGALLSPVREVLRFRDAVGPRGSSYPPPHDSTAPLLHPSPRRAAAVVGPPRARPGCGRRGAKPTSSKEELSLKELQAKRNKVRAEKAEKASKVNALKASDAEIEEALDDLSDSVTARDPGTRGRGARRPAGADRPRRGHAGRDRRRQPTRQPQLLDQGAGHRRLRERARRRGLVAPLDRGPQRRPEPPHAHRVPVEREPRRRRELPHVPGRPRRAARRQGRGSSAAPSTTRASQGAPRLTRPRHKQQQSTSRTRSRPASNASSPRPARSAELDAELSGQITQQQSRDRGRARRTAPQAETAKRR